MKKYIVLTVLFVLPLVVYLFFASGVNHFAKLPVRSNSVVELSTYAEIPFKERITILGFLGSNVETKKSNALNLNQKIYKRFKEIYSADDPQELNCYLDPDAKPYLESVSKEIEFENFLVWLRDSINSGDTGIIHCYKDDENRSGNERLKFKNKKK